MKFLKYKELKEIEKKNQGASKKAFLKAAIIAATVVAVLVVLAPSIEENILFISLAFGFTSLFVIYSTSMNEINLLNRIDSLQNTPKEKR